ncbi:MAG: hypothetical protein HDS65_00050 [Bacteroidales bacterium]|nr:hypothetical protein [Bacteroidales bacterium]
MDAARFTPGAERYVKAEAMRRLSRVWWLAALVIAATAVACCNDSRYFFLGLMLLFIVYPMAVSFMWMILAGNKAVVLFSRPQEWSFTDDGAEVRFYPYKADEDTPPVATVQIPFARIISTEDKGKWLLIRAKELPHNFPFLLIPADSVPAKAYDQLCRI